MRSWVTGAILAALLLVSGFSILGWHRSDSRVRRLAEQLREAERARLEQGSLLLASRKKAGEAEKLVSKMAAQSISIKKQLEDVLARASEPKPEVMIHGGGDVVTITACPEPEPPGVVPVERERDTTPLKFRPRFDLVGIRSSLGNHVLIGEMYGLEPGTDKRLWEAPVRADVSRYWIVPKTPSPPPRSSGIGVRAEYQDGFRIGPAFSPRPRRLGAWRLDASTDLTFGDGSLAVGATVILRR